MTESELAELFAWGEELARRHNLTPEKSRFILEAVRRGEVNREFVELVLRLIDKYQPTLEALQEL